MTSDAFEAAWPQLAKILSSRAASLRGRVRAVCRATGWARRDVAAVLWPHTAAIGRGRESWERVPYATRSQYYAWHHATRSETRAARLEAERIRLGIEACRSHGHWPLDAAEAEADRLDRVEASRLHAKIVSSGVLPTKSGAGELRLDVRHVNANAEPQHAVATSYGDQSSVARSYGWRVIDHTITLEIPRGSRVVTDDSGAVVIVCAHAWRVRKGRGLSLALDKGVLVQESGCTVWARSRRAGLTAIRRRYAAVLA